MEKLDKNIKEYIIEYLTSIGDSPTEDYIMDIIRYGKTVSTEIVGQHRWYDDQLKVTKIGDRFVGFLDYYMTGDACASDMDLEFDWESVSFYESYEVIVTKYKPMD